MSKNNTGAAMAEFDPLAYVNQKAAQSGGFDPLAYVSKPKKETSTLGEVADYVNKAGQAAAQGVTFGFQDEISAGLDSPFVAGYRTLAEGQPFDMGKAYDDRLKVYRGAQNEFREEYPISALTAETAGAVAGAVANPAVRALTTPAQGASLAARMGQGAATGAGMGATYGFGAGEGTENRLKGAAGGAALGGLVGGVAPAVIDGVRAGGRYIADQTINRLPFRQTDAASRKVAEALVRDGMTPDQALARVQQLGPEAALLDVGPNSTALARAAYTVPGEGKTRIGEFLTNRQEGTRNANNVLQGGQINRIVSGMDDLVPDQYTTAQRRALEATRSAKGDPLYQATANDAQNLIPEEKFAQISADPFTAGVIKRVKSKSLYGMGDMPDNSMPVIDAAKKQFDDMISAAQRAGKNNEARLLIDKKNALVAVADEAFPDYAKARSVWSEFSGVIDSGDLGRKFMRGEVDGLKDAVSRMSEAERHQFRVGVAQAIRDRVGGLVTRADATKKLMDIPALESKIQTAFGDDEVFKKYIGLLQNERTMFDPYAKIMGGSRTAEVMAEQADSGVDKGRIAQGVAGILNPVSPTGFMQGIGQVAGGLKDRATTSAPMSRRLSEILTGRDVEPVKKAIEDLKMTDAAKRSLTRMLLSGAAVGSGRMSPQGQ